MLWCSDMWQGRNESKRDSCGVKGSCWNGGSRDHN